MRLGIGVPNTTQEAAVTSATIDLFDLLDLFLVSPRLSALRSTCGGRACGCQAELRKTSENNIFKPNKPEKPRTSGAMSFGLRDAMRSQLHAF